MILVVAIDRSFKPAWIDQHLGILSFSFFLKNKPTRVSSFSLGILSYTICLDAVILCSIVLSKYDEPCC